MSSKKNNNAEVLFPDRELVLNGEPITVKELSFLQGLKLSAVAQPLIKSMSLILNDEVEVTFTSLSEIFATYSAQLVTLMAASTGKDEAWISQLNDTDGQSLLMTFWSVNKAFFINRLLLSGVESQRQTTVKT